MLWGFLAQVGWSVSCVPVQVGLGRQRKRRLLWAEERGRGRKEQAWSGTCHNNAA